MGTLGEVEVRDVLAFTLVAALESVSHDREGGEAMLVNPASKQLGAIGERCLAVGPRHLALNRDGHAQDDVTLAIAPRDRAEVARDERCALVVAKRLQLGS